jgi:pyroglutamyl-peptidase
MNSSVPALVVLAALGLTGSILRAQTPATPPPDILVSGFEAFGGRTENASWTLAEEIAKAFPQEVRSLQVPVVWGAPLTTINNAKPLPQVWIAFGEGTAEFQIETIAHNLRGRYPDNHGTKPSTPDVVNEAEPELHQTAKVEGLAEALTQAGFPTHVSQNAGRYLCEEMLYSLLHAQKQHPEALRLVLFIHVPPLAQTVKLAPSKAGAPATKQKVDAVWLQAFGKQLFASMRQLGLLASVPAR